MIGRKAHPSPQDQDKPMSFDDYDLRLGDIMRGERATLGKSLLDVQRELKIRANYIAAIEECDIAQFESQGFIAGYVRSYARYLGLDPEWTFARFCDEAGFAVSDGLSLTAAKSTEPRPLRADAPDPLANPAINFIPPRESVFSRIEPAAIGSVTILVALIGAVGYGGWTVLQEVQRVQIAPTDRSPDVVAQLDAAPAFGDIASAQEAELNMPGADAFDRLYRPQALEAPVLTARDGPIATINPHSGTSGTADRARIADARDLVGRGGRMASVSPERAGEDSGARAPDGELSVAEAVADSVAERLREGMGQADEAVADAADVQVVEDAAPAVEILAVSEAWMRVTGSDGTILMERVLAEGETYAVPQTEEPPRLRVGNSGAVYFVVGDATYGPVAPGAQVVDNVALSAESLTSELAAADPDSNPDLREAVAIAAAAD